MAEISKEMIKGSLPLVILQTLSRGEEYGYSLAQEIRKGTKNLLKAGEGTLYPALYKLEGEGYITSRWDDGFKPKRKYYSLTSKGARLLEHQKEEWSEFIEVMQSYLSFDGGVTR